MFLIGLFTSCVMFVAMYSDNLRADVMYRCVTVWSVSSVSGFLSICMSIRLSLLFYVSLFSEVCVNGVEIVRMGGGGGVGIKLPDVNDVVYSKCKTAELCFIVVFQWCTLNLDFNGAL